MPVKVSSGGASGATWTEKYSVDFSAESAVDIKAGSTLTDAAGVTWQTSDSTVTGEGSCSTLGTDGATGINIVTSATADVTVGQAFNDLFSGYDHDDVIAVAIETSHTAMAANYQFMGLMIGPLADVSERIQIVNNYNGGTKVLSRRKQSLGSGAADDSGSTQHAAAASNVFAAVVCRDSVQVFYGSTMPTSPPFTGLTEGGPLSFNRSTASPTQPSTATDLGFWLQVNRNSGTNLDVFLKQAAVWRLE